MKRSPENTGESPELWPELKLEGRVWDLPSDPAVLKPALEEFERRLVQAGWNEEEIRALILGADEAITNAIVHGNLQVKSKKEYADNIAYVQAIAEAKKSELGKRLVRLLIDVDPDLVRLSIADEGDGFNPETLPDPRDKAMQLEQGGRGVFLMKHTYDIVGYSEKGNQVWLEKRRTHKA
jgi:anti-sigma regulatory factor (Ser/Thr protein kinase)